MDDVRRTVKTWQRGALVRSRVLRYRLLRRRLRLEHWWRLQDRRYGFIWRAGNALFAALILAGVVVPIAQDIMSSQSYQLSANTLKLVGNTDRKLTKQLTYDAQSGTYVFNKSVVQSAGETQQNNPATALMRAQTGTATGQGSNKSLYGLTVPTDFSRGVTYYDSNSGLSFSLVPQFGAANAEKVDGHLVFPLSGGKQAIYTLKNNGLKEDVVVPHAAGNDLTLSYSLNLPNTLEAKVIPGSGGNIGIYSADPALFGNITYGDNADQAAIQKARVTSPKTNLVFGLPSPVIKLPDGSQPASASARFTLQGNTLSVVATGLHSIHGAFSVDPSVVVTSTTDFQLGGNNEGMIDFSTSGQVTRGGLSGGGLSGGWTASANSLASGVSNQSSVAYNGYLYVLGGQNASSNYLATIQYTPINSNGTIGTWATAANSFANVRAQFAAVAYNGYMYILGGGNGTGTLYNDVQYAPINADGSVGTWATTTSFTTARSGLSSVVYNGYLYVLGGMGTINTLSDVQYAPINADGSVGTWATTTSFPTARVNFVSVVYNGYMYVVGGLGPSGGLSDVQYAAINANGTVGTWRATTSFTNGRYSLTSVVYNGYLYVLGGYDGTTYYSDVQYAAINANGTVGTWRATASFTTARYSHSSVAYNGYVYIVGGLSSSSTLADIQYAKVDPAGVTTSYSTTTALLGEASGGKTYSARIGQTTVAYNGYLYVLGGYTAQPAAHYYNSVIYAPINANGTIGTWATTTAFTTARAYHTSVAYNGYLYVLGGYNGTTSYNDVQYAPINSNGTIGTWATTTAFTTARYGHTTVAYNGYLYVLGGFGAAYYNDVQYAPINSNGTIGTWATTTAFTTARYRHASVAYNGYLYVVGGVESGVSLGDVQYAPINANGTIGTWATTTAFTTARYGHTTVAYNGYLYVIGGNGNAAALNDVQYAPINSNGTIGTWATTTAFTTARYSHASVVYNGYLYVLGGYNGTTYYSDVQYAQINNGGSGTAGTWATTTAFTTARYGHTSVAYNGYLYVIGGAGSINLSDVQYAPINANGTIGTWTATTSFTTARSYHTSVAYNGYLYVIGGWGSTYLSDVQYAPINSNGTIGTWQTTTSFTTARAYHTSVAYNGYLYVIGGTNTGILSDVQYAPINANGTIGTWTATTSLTIARNSMTSVAYNGYLYVIGGSGNSGNFNDVQYAPINANGTIGTWQTTTSFIAPRYGQSSVAYNGYLYVLGGFDGATYYNDVQYAPINANGTVGAWQTTVGFTSTRESQSSVAYNGYVYVLGGLASNASPLNDVQYSSLSSIARRGQYSKLVDLGASRSVTGLTYNGVVPALFNGGSAVMYRAAGVDGVFGAAASAASLSGSGGSTCSGSGVSARYLFVTVTLDDSYGQGTGGIFADTVGTNANMTDFTISYSSGANPPPNIRLRGGQTLQAGNLSGLDTCQ